ncbi:NUDIX hydrolase [Jatrophihabitans sp. DSM 45814]
MADAVTTETAAVPARVQEAATVILLRDGENGLETWLLRRVEKMAFAAGMSVFPGGSVDPGDADTAAAGSGYPGNLSSIAAQLETDVSHAGALVCAAIRETFEEVGVLLSRPAALASEQARTDVEDGRRTFLSLLSELQVELDESAIRPWARWITPVGAPIRFDTYFFVAVVPDGATAASVTGEASHADWIPISEALSEFERGERPMLPPTFTNLRQVAQHTTAAEVLSAAAGREIRQVAPVVHRSETGEVTLVIDGAEVKMPGGLPEVPDPVTRTGRPEQGSN